MIYGAIDLERIKTKNGEFTQTRPKITEIVYKWLLSCLATNRIDPLDSTMNIDTFDEIRPL